MRHARHRRPRTRGRADRHARFAQPAVAPGGGPRSPARRAVQLMLALCAGAVALGTVFAMVAIVVTLGNREIGKLPLTSVGGIPSLPSAAVATTFATYHGAAGTHQRPIEVDVAGRWGIHWSFTCPDGQPGHFALQDTTTNAARKVNVRTSGKTRQGIWWGTGPHSLLVTSNCRWNVSLLQPPRHHRTSGPTHTPGPTTSPSNTPTPSPSSTPSPSPPPSPPPSPSPSPHHTRTPNPHHTHAPPKHTPRP